MHAINITTVDGAVSESCYTAADHLDSEWPGEGEAANECPGDSVDADEQPVDAGCLSGGRKNISCSINF